MTTKSRPPRDYEVERRLNAFKAARLVLGSTTKGIEEAAKDVGSNRHSVGITITILQFGTEQEIKGVENGTLSLNTTYDAILARTTSAERKAKQRAPTQTAAVVQAREIDAQVWGKLRDALDALTGMPSAKDTATIVRKNPMRIEHVNRKLIAAIVWIGEFENEVTK